MASRRNNKASGERSLRDRLTAAAQPDNDEASDPVASEHPEPELSVVADIEDDSTDVDLDLDVEAEPDPEPDPEPDIEPVSAVDAADEEHELVAELTSAQPDPQPRPRRAPRIAPHAARQANRARRTSFALLFVPFFAIYVILDAFRDLRDHFNRARNLELERRPPFRRPDAMPAPENRSMEEIVSVVESFPFRPLKIPPQVAFFRDNGADAIGALLSPFPQINTIPHVYPKPFLQRLFTGHDGVELAGMQAMHEHSGPAVVICHGLMMIKNFDVIIQLAKRAFQEWGFHVVTLDLRGWGQSTWTSDMPSSAGYYEGHDIVEVCRELHRNPLVTSVGAIGYSLGGASVLNASRVSSEAQDRPLDGGGIAVSAPVDVNVALEYISTKPHWRDPYHGLWNVFRAAIKSTVRHRGLPQGISTWKDLVEFASTPAYGLSMEEFCDRASAKFFAQDIDQPLLQIHATDDFLVPVHHAHLLREVAADNPWVHVMVREAGNHCAFAAVDSAWYHSTMRRWLEYWATPGEFESAPEDAEDVLTELV